MMNYKGVIGQSNCLCNSESMGLTYSDNIYTVDVSTKIPLKVKKVKFSTQLIWAFFILFFIRS